MAAVWTETSGSLTASSATIAANLLRRELIVSNNSDTVMTLSIGGTATADVGISIPAGTAIRLGRMAGGARGDTVPQAALTLFCAGTAKKYSVYEC